MPLKPCRGSSLVDLLVALVLLGLIGVLLTRSALSMGRATGRLLARTAAQQVLDQGVAWLASELADLGPGDLHRMAAESLSYRGYRRAGLACLVAAGEVRLLIEPGGGWGDPQPGRDSLLLYLGGAGDSAWVAQPVTAVSSTSCAGRPAWRLATITDSVAARRAAGVAFPPVRLFESMQSRLYQSSGDWWLGARSESSGEAIQPLTGPLTAGGLRLSYRDSLRQPASGPEAVRQVAMLLTATPGAPDSASITLAPWNLQP